MSGQRSGLGTCSSGQGCLSLHSITPCTRNRLKAPSPSVFLPFSLAGHDHYCDRVNVRQAHKYDSELYEFAVVLQLLDAVVFGIAHEFRPPAAAASPNGTSPDADAAAAAAAAAAFIAAEARAAATAAAMAANSSAAASQVGLAQPHMYRTHVVLNYVVILYRSKGVTMCKPWPPTAVLLLPRRGQGRVSLVLKDCKATPGGTPGETSFLAAGPPVRPTWPPSPPAPPRRTTAADTSA